MSTMCQALELHDEQEGKGAVLGTQAFGEDVYKSKMTTNRIAKNRKNPTFTWERGKKMNSNQINQQK